MLTETQTVAPTAPPALALSFPQGLPGFPEVTDFRLERLPASPRFLRLRSTDPGGPEFIVLPQAGSPVPIEDSDVAEGCGAVGLDPADVAVLLVVRASREGAGPALSVNRRAPLLVDLRRHLGFQVVLPRPDYAVRHPIAA